jgi:hypothetical protein
MPERVSRALTLAVAVVGVVLIATGLSWLAAGITVPATAWTVLGVVLFWWAVAEHRKSMPGTPESEERGDHTVE